MKGLAAAVAALLLVGTMGVRAAPVEPPAVPVTVAYATQFDLPSRISGRTYRIFVYRPPTPPPASGWPVVTVTDGNSVFPLATAALQLRAATGAAALIVGVGYPVADPRAALALRNRDLTPPTPASGLPHRNGLPLPNPDEFGGADLFYRFLTEELRPAITAHFPASATDQTLYGHSFGGLFVLGVLFAHPDAYRTYVASSPSIWWNNRAVLQREAGFARAVTAGRIESRVLIMVGANEAKPSDLAPPRGMTRADLVAIATQTRMVDNARELAGRLDSLRGSAGYRVVLNVFDAEDHLSVIPASVGRALTFALTP